MKNASQYWFGKSLSEILPEEDISTLMAVDGYMGKPTAFQDYAGFVRDAFYADCTPVIHATDTIYPAYAPWYLGTPIPEAFLRIENTYSRTAAQAAISWTAGIFGRDTHPGKTCDALSFECPFQNHILSVQFPLYSQFLADGAIVVPVADTWRNDSEWGQGVVPSYVEQHVRFLLWCYRYYHHNRDDNLTVPDRAYVTRIIGNLPTDVMVYTVFADAGVDQKVADRVFRAFTKAKAAGANPLLSLKSQPEIPWMEQREAELADAYHTDDPVLYDLIQRYMAARSTRKELEAKDKDLKAKADAIAISLAALTKDDVSTGKLIVDKTAYTVKHTPSRKQPPRITSALIYQFAPNHANQVITEGARKVTVSIDVL